MSVFILDTRNQKDDFVEVALVKLGHTVVRSKLPFGDVALSTNILNCIDLKSSGGGLIEVSRNRCSKDHNRMKKEIEECINVGGKITFLCFEPGIKDIDDIVNWEVPTFKNDQWRIKYYELGTNKPLTKTQIEKNNIKNYYTKKEKVAKKGDKMTSVNPETLMKSIKTMCTPGHYKEGTKVDFIFTNKKDCGEAIIDILCN